MAVEAGSAAPDFALNDHNREQVTLSALWREKNVLLVFFPFAFSQICQGEMCQVRDELAGYGDEDVQVVGVSVDTPFSLKVWAEQQGFSFPLLSDFWPHGAVAKAYGVFNDVGGMANRGTFLIDTKGIVRFAEIVSPREARDQAEWKKAVAALRG
ncbi:peroxiredoxin [Amycolatopsis sp. NPDC059027]|uniref:peroxiredoxin n=1 Tax=unclassified Amycolatopsis TaxID=2618356 RepID=UPI00366A6487